jgi:hypothetical protein
MDRASHARQRPPTRIGASAVEAHWLRCG